MPSIVVRNVDEALKMKLRVRAAHHGRSMEEEVRSILRAVLAEESSSTGQNLADYARSLFEPLGGVEISVPQRDPVREPPDFSDFH